MNMILEVITKLFPLVYAIIIFVAGYVWLRFEWGAEGKDERGQTILNLSYRISSPLFPLGWFIIKMIDDYAYPISYELYKELIWFLLTGLIIIHAIAITFFKRKY